MSNTRNNDRQYFKRSRSVNCSPTLLVDDASLVKGMLARGDAQHNITAWFGVNPGRIAEIATGEKFRAAPVANAADLPPPGPYVAPSQLAAVEEAVITARRALDAAERIVRNQRN